MSEFREKFDKLRGADRYLNISALLIFYFPVVLRIFYALRIPHEVITLTSIACGVGSAVSIYQGDMITAAVLFHLKDTADACDGAMARMTNRGHRIGRFLDTIGDFVSIGLVFGAVAWLEYSLSGDYGVLIFGALAVLSIFLQCSYFNFYQLKYVEYSKHRTLSSRTDESVTDEDRTQFNSRILNFLLLVLQRLYSIIFGWQDMLMRKLDLSLVRIIFRDKPLNNNNLREWYHHKPLMVINSFLCFGTHIFTMVVCLLVGKPIISFYVIVFGFNIYWALAVLCRIWRFGRRNSNLLQMEKPLVT